MRLSTSTPAHHNENHQRQNYDQHSTKRSSHNSWNCRHRALLVGKGIEVMSCRDRGETSGWYKRRIKVDLRGRNAGTHACEVAVRGFQLAEYRIIGIILVGIGWLRVFSDKAMALDRADRLAEHGLVRACDLRGGQTVPISVKE